MPAERFTRRANTPKKRRQWQHVYESARARGAEEGSAIAQASGVIKQADIRQGQKRRHFRRGRGRKR